MVLALDVVYELEAVLVQVDAQHLIVAGIVQVFQNKVLRLPACGH